MQKALLPESRRADILQSSNDYLPLNDKITPRIITIVLNESAIAEFNWFSFRASLLTICKNEEVLFWGVAGKGERRCHSL
jgi:hypothetical protein